MTMYTKIIRLYCVHAVRIILEYQAIFLQDRYTRHMKMLKINLFKKRKRKKKKTRVEWCFIPLE